MGHECREWPHGTHVAKWPHGMQANRFSSIKQRTHGLDGDESCDWFWLLLVEDVVSFVSDCDDVVTST